MSKLDTELRAVRDRAVALSAGQRLKLGTRQSLAGLSNVTRGSAGLSAAGVRRSVAGAGAATRGTAVAAWSGAKKLTAQARSTEAQLVEKAADVFPVHITNPTVVSGLERAGLADALPEQLATTRPASRRRLKIALISVGVFAAGAAAFAITRRTRPQPPSVAAAPPRLSDVPVAGEEAKSLDHASPSANGQASG